MTAPDFVAVGHLTLDHLGSTLRPGGAALYAAVTAQRLGLSAGILTSHAPDYPLESLPFAIEVVSVPGERTTVFEHARNDTARALRVTSVAERLTAADVPEDWHDAPLVLLAPVLDEVDAGVAAVFADATLGGAAQGWLRTLGAEGAVRERPWSVPAFLLARIQALFLSTEDMQGQEAVLAEAFQRVPVGALTAGESGALLYVNGERYEVRPHRVREVDATGAGDVFAAAFLVEYARHGDPWVAGEAAACAAALSVQGESWTAVPDRKALTAALQRYRARA
jgi:sugar/nucleoside kinase (ribokinase family)